MMAAAVCVSNVKIKKLKHLPCVIPARELGSRDKKQNH
jgi:hypothetical protein